MEADMGRMGLLAPVGALLLMGFAPEKVQEQAYREAGNGEIVFKSYPPASLRAGEHGTVGFEVALFKDGRLRSCAVTKSSGFTRLDDATCDMIVRYAQFNSAEARLNARGMLNGQVRWELPAGLVKAVPPPATVQQKISLAAKDEGLFCRRTLKVGSLQRSTKLCLTRSDWAKAEEIARKQTEDMREKKGPLQ